MAQNDSPKPSHHIRLNTSRLQGIYAITDQKLIAEKTFATAVEQALRGGARIIQYRDKSDDATKRKAQAQALQLLCSQYQALSIINDDINLALESGADGIHLGRDDHSLEEARKRLGDNAVIGISCYNDIQRAYIAQENGADYVAFGAIFSSSTKPLAPTAGVEIIAQAKTELSIPVCCIGGITSKNISQVIDKGANMVAIVSGIFSNENIEEATQSLNNHFK